MREKVGKSRNTVFFQWFVAQEGRNVGSLKRRVRSQLATGAMKNCTPLWREAHFQVKMYKTHQLWTTFTSWDVEKVHAVVARSTFRSENVQSTPCTDHFWRFRCRKSARCCGAKHISKWKCTKHIIVGPLLEVQMSKKCTLLWREAHFQAKMYKTHHVRTIFGGSEVVSRGRRKGLWTLSKVSRTSGFCSKFNYNYNYTSLQSTTLHYTTLHYTALNYTQLHSITLHYTTLHYTTLHYTTLHYTTLHYTTLHYITLHYLLLHYITLHSTTLHYITLHYTTLHYTTLHLHLQLHSTTLNYTTLHYTTLHTTTLHYTTLHYTTLHYITLNDTAPQIDR